MKQSEKRIKALLKRGYDKNKVLKHFNAKEAPPTSQKNEAS